VLLLDEFTKFRRASRRAAGRTLEDASGVIANGYIR
jgi:hypothetical protein